jgi:hypothetical protein
MVQLGTGIAHKESVGRGNRHLRKGPGCQQGLDCQGPMTKGDAI